MGANVFIATHRPTPSPTTPPTPASSATSGLTPPATSSRSTRSRKTSSWNWRKANQIHGWFVDNAQGGEDECQGHYVSRESLKDLVTLCKDLLATRDETKAKDKLAPRSGFCFGSDQIGDYYWEDLTETVTQLEPLIAFLDTPEGVCWEVYYQSSW